LIVYVNVASKLAAYPFVTAMTLSDVVFGIALGDMYYVELLPVSSRLSC
jgi:hypothetical protein